MNSMAYSRGGGGGLNTKAKAEDGLAVERRWGEAASDRVELPYTTKGRVCNTYNKMAQQSWRCPQFSSGRI
jgi:hypothetical protein